MMLPTDNTHQQSTHNYDEEADVACHEAEYEIQTTRRFERQKRYFLIAMVALPLFLGLVIVTHSLVPTPSATTTDAAEKAELEDLATSSSAHTATPMTPKPLPAKKTRPPSMAPQEQLEQTGKPSPTTSSENSAAATSTNAPQHQTAKPTDAPVAAWKHPEPGCLGDRFDNENMAKNNRLYAGQFICSKDSERRYHFGVSETGDLILKDTQTNDIQTVYQNTQESNNNKNSIQDNGSKATTTSGSDNKYDYYFSLHTDGTFKMHRVNTLHGKEKLQWKLKPKYNMTLYESCLADHDCPYLHLHSDGVLVLNWIDTASSDWIVKNFNKAYEFKNN
jgi:hypothetical protein